MGHVKEGFFFFPQIHFKYNFLSCEHKNCTEMDNELNFAATDQNTRERQQRPVSADKSGTVKCPKRSWLLQTLHVRDE